MIAGIYCRVSTEDQAQEGTSLDTQLEACLLKAREAGYEVSDELIFRESFSRSPGLRKIYKASFTLMDFFLPVMKPQKLISPHGYFNSSIL